MRWMLLVLTSLLMLRCAAMMPGAHTPDVRHRTVTHAPDQAYRHAVRTASRMGAQIIHQDAQTRTLRAHLHNAVTLTVLVIPTGSGATVEVAARLLPNKVVLGRMTEAQDFLTAYQQEE